MNLDIFIMVKLVNPLVNRDSCYKQRIGPLILSETKLFQVKYKFTKPFHLLVN
jgi:hypothetical protein